MRLCCTVQAKALPVYEDLLQKEEGLVCNDMKTINITIPTYIDHTMFIPSRMWCI